VAEIIGFDDEMRDADLLVTGEGSTDEQTADGKLPIVLAAQARAAGAKTLLISGTLRGNLSEIEPHFDGMYATVRETEPTAAAVEHGRMNLAETASDVGRALAEKAALIGRR
jgi:glycerate kinase